MKNYCENFKGIATAKTEHAILVARLRCKMWSCQYCAKQNARVWRASIIDGINKLESDTWSFITITCPSWIHNQELRFDRVYDSYKLIKTATDILMKRLKRWLGAFQYVRVVENHKSGVAHMHMLISTHIPDSKPTRRADGSVYNHSDILMSHLTACGFGYVHDAKNLVDDDGKAWHAGSVASYISKYMTKTDALDLADMKDMKIRKIQTSRAFKAPKSEPENDWKIKSGVYLDDLYNDEKLPLYDISADHVITSDDFLETFIYPADLT